MWLIESFENGFPDEPKPLLGIETKCVSTCRANTPMSVYVQTKEHNIFGDHKILEQ